MDVWYLGLLPSRPRYCFREPSERYRTRPQPSGPERSKDATRVCGGEPLSRARCEVKVQAHGKNAGDSIVRESPAIEEVRKFAKLCNRTKQRRLTGPPLFVEHLLRSEQEVDAGRIPKIVNVGIVPRQKARQTRQVVIRSDRAERDIFADLDVKAAARQHGEPRP